jgi:hypothetical protein
MKHPFAHVIALVAVAELNGLVFARRGAGGHDGASKGAAFQNDVGFNSGISARVEDFAGTNGNYLGHIAPQDSVLQPGIQGGHFGATIHGKVFSGGALNGVQKLLHEWISSNFCSKKSIDRPYGF